MKTTLTKYHINTSTQEGAEAWRDLKLKLRATKGRGRRMKALQMPGSYDRERQMPEGEIELDPTHLFDNQWNTVDTDEGNGWRVFDWDQRIVPNPHIKCGHYLTITEEMIEARNSRRCCGYCGKQTDDPAPEFCDKCIGGEYLKESELKLLRLMPASWDKFQNDRPPLTDRERDELVPIHRERTKERRRAQNKARVARQRADAQRKVKQAEHELEVTDWLIEHDIDPGLAIYYSHTDRWCFGWREPLGPEEVEELLGKLGSEFPAEYDIKQTEAARLA
jgi:hypothetical protein